MKSILFAVAALVLSTGVAFADTSATPAPLSPSAVVGAASTYDDQTITVTGTVKNVTSHDTPRGTISRYQICDSQCVNVVQFSAAPAEGQTQTVTGHFRANVDRGHFKATDVIMVGPSGGWRHGH